MELQEMKSVWSAMEEEKRFTSYRISEVSQREYNRKTSSFRMGEIIGLVVAYTIAGLVLYNFNALDDGYLRLCGCVLVVYLLIMPLYTLFQIWKMKHIDLVQSNYKHVLERFYAAKNNLKKAEKISLIASPVLFIATIAILTKLLADKNLFSLSIQLPIIFLVGIALIGAILFNVWAFKMRDKQFKSVNELLEDEN
jgi:MFS family permease